MLLRYRTILFRAAQAWEACPKAFVDLQAVTKRQARERADARHMVAQSTLDAFIIRARSAGQGPANLAAHPSDPAIHRAAGKEPGLRPGAHGGLCDPKPKSDPLPDARAARKPRRALKQLYLSSPEAGAGGSDASQGGLSSTSEQPGPARTAASGRQAELQLDLHQKPGNPSLDPTSGARAAPGRPGRARRLQVPARAAPAKVARAHEAASAPSGEAGDGLGGAAVAGAAAGNPMLIDLTALSPEVGPRASKRPAARCGGDGEDTAGMPPGFDRFRFQSGGERGDAGCKCCAALSHEAAAWEARPRKRAHAEAKT